MIWRKREKIKRWHKAFFQLLAAAIGKAMLQNMMKAQKGEKATATISPLSLIGGGEEDEGGDAKDAGDLKDIKLKPEDAKSFTKEYKSLTSKDRPQRQLTKDIQEFREPASLAFPSRPQIQEVNRPFQDQLRYGGAGQTPIQQPQATIPQGFLPTAQAATQATAPSSVPQSIQTAVPPRPIQEPTTTPPGFLAGLSRGFLGMPQPEEAGGAYYAGKMIPDIMRSRMGLPTTGQEARTQQQAKYYKTKERSPEYTKDLEESMKRLPNLSEEQKIVLYQEMAIKYPEFSSELKRIFLPASGGSNIDDLIQAIIMGRGE